MKAPQQDRSALRTSNNMTRKPLGIAQAENRAHQLFLSFADSPCPPRALDLQQILPAIPHKFWSPAPKPNGCIVFGLSPSKLLTGFISLHFPHHKFSCVAVRVGGKLEVHQDFATLGLSVVGSGSGDTPCGFWISDPLGSDFEEFGEKLVPGLIINLSEGPVEFDAKVPHCGYIDSRNRQHDKMPRISIAAFHLRRSYSADSTKSGIHPPQPAARLSPHLT